MTQFLILLLSGTVVCALVAAILRARRTAQWRAERRSEERRGLFRRTSDDRRNDLRQRHDTRHNADRRDEERRDGERRDGESWKENYIDLKDQLEEKKHDNRNA